MKLIELKRNNEREIKSVVYIDEKNNICVSYDEFEFIKKRYPKSITVYSPNVEQQKDLFELLQNDMVIEEKENKSELKSNLSVENSYNILKELTDVELDDETEDKKIIEEIMSNPTPLLLRVNDELNQIMNALFIRLYDNMIEVGKMPEGIRETIFTKAENEKLAQEILKEEEELKALREKKEQELKDLENKLKTKGSKRKAKSV